MPDNDTQVIPALTSEVNALDFKLCENTDPSV